MSKEIIFKAIWNNKIIIFREKKHTRENKTPPM